MDKLTRGNLLATLKSLKKHKRPKSVAANASVAVQAICPQKVNVNKAADIKAVLERRKALVGRNTNTTSGDKSSAVYMQFENDFELFMNSYRNKPVENLDSIQDDGL